MKSQLFFVVLVTLGQSSSVSSRRPAGCKRTDGGLIDVSVLRARGEKAVLAMCDAHDTFFDGIQRESAKYIFDLEPATTQKDSTVNATDRTLDSKIGSDNILESIHIALKKQCSGVEVARKKLYSYIDDTFASVGPVVKMASDGNYPVIRAAIEHCCAETQYNVLGLTQVIYQVIRTNLNSTDTDTLAAVQTAENGSMTKRIKNVAAAFDAIKLLAVAITHGDKSLSLIYEIERCRAGAQYELRKSISYVNGLLEALYIKSCLNNNAVKVSHLSANRYATILRLKNIEQLVEKVFGPIIDEAKKIILGISNHDEKKVYSVYNVARAELGATLEAEGKYFFQSIPTLSPNILNKIGENRKNLTAWIDQLISDYVLLLRGALDQTKSYKEVISYIRNRTEQMNQVSEEFINAFIAPIRDEQTWNDEVKTEFFAKVQKIHTIPAPYFKYVQSALEILARIARTNGTGNQDDISAIQVIKSKTISLLHNYIDLTSDACIYPLLVSKSSST